MRYFLAFFNTRRSPALHGHQSPRFRPTLEGLETRDVPSAATLAAPVFGAAHSAAAAHTQQAGSLFPITVNSVTTRIVDGALELVANATTAAGRVVEIPLTLTSALNGTTPILHLEVGAIHLELLGLNVDTSDICLSITAQSGSGNLLGNLLGDVANLLNGGLNLNDVLGGLTGGQLGTLTSGIQDLLNGAFGALGSPTNAATGATSVTSSGTTQILHLAVGPLDLNLLGLMVHLDDCNNGPVTVDITAQSGPGNLLGNLLGGLSHLLDGNANNHALINRLERIADRILDIL